MFPTRRSLTFFPFQHLAVYPIKLKFQYRLGAYVFTGKYLEIVSLRVRRSSLQLRYAGLRPGEIASPLRRSQ